MIELPHAVFSHAGHWELRDDAALEDFPLDGHAPAVATATKPATTLLFRHYVQVIYDAMNIMDDERTIPNHEEVLNAMKTAAELCQQYIPVLAEHSLSNKRQRQRQ